jgi:hypothetical protein
VSLERVRGFVARVRNTVDDREVYPRKTQYLDVVLLMLLSKAVRVSEATCTLVGAGHYEEAFGLSRTLIDLFFTSRYIANRESLERADKFVRFWAKDYTAWIAVIEKYYSSGTFVRPPHHEEMVEVAREYRSPHKWTGLGDQTKQMALEPYSPEASADGAPVTAEFDYEVIYKWTSHFVHPTIAALDSHGIEPGDAFTVFASEEKAEKFQRLALFNVVAFLAKTLARCLEGLRTSLPKDLADESVGLLNELK